MPLMVGGHPQQMELAIEYMETTTVSLQVIGMFSTPIGLEYLSQLPSMATTTLMPMIRASIHVLPRMRTVPVSKWFQLGLQPVV